MSYLWQVGLTSMFDSVLVSVPTGADTSLAVSFSMIETLLDSAMVAVGDSVMLYHRAVAVGADSAMAAGRPFLVTLVRGGVVSDIASARGRGAGATVTVEGVVTRASGGVVYLQDESGAFLITQASGAFFDAIAGGEIAPGKRLQVSGVLTDMNGELMISQVQRFEVMGAGQAPAVQTVTLAELVANGGMYAGELVRVENLTMTAMDSTLEAGMSYLVSDGSGATFTLRIAEEAEALEGKGSPAGTFTFVGVLGRIEGGYALLAIDEADIQAGAYVSAEDDVAVPTRFMVEGNYPNPFNPSTRIRFDLPEAAQVRVEVYDMTGRRVMQIAERAFGAGAGQTLEVDGTGLGSGMYVYRVIARTAEGTTAGAGRMVLLK